MGGTEHIHKIGKDSTLNEVRIKIPNSRIFLETKDTVAGTMFKSRHVKEFSVLITVSNKRGSRFQEPKVPFQRQKAIVIILKGFLKHLESKGDPIHGKILDTFKTLKNFFLLGKNIPKNLPAPSFCFIHKIKGASRNR